jgi:hypothetical protein
MEIVADREVGRKQRGMVVAAQMDCFSALPGGYERAKSPSEAEGRGSLNTMKAVRAHKRGGPEVLRYEDAPRCLNSLRADRTEASLDGHVYG